MTLGRVDRQSLTEKANFMPNNPYPAERQTRNQKPPISARLVMEGLQTKQQIINELIAGRMELLQATARFQTVHRTTAVSIESATGIPAGVSNGENLCRTVIGWVCLSLSGRPEEAERVSARLERDLQGHLDRFGEVNLPPAR